MLQLCSVQSLRTAVSDDDVVSETVDSVPLQQNNNR